MTFPSTLNVEKNILAGDGSTVAFTVSSSIVSENNTQVYIDGVYQSKDNYSTSGSTVTFTTAPPNGAEIEVIHFVSVQGAIKVDSFTGDNSAVAFTTGASIIDEDNTQNRKDFNKIKIPLYLGAAIFNFKKCKDLCASLTQMLEHMLEDRC